MRLLERIFRNPFLQDRMVLLGGASRSLFGQSAALLAYDRLPQDIDLAYIGHPNWEGMLEEKPQVVRELETCFADAGLNAHQSIGDKFRGNWVLEGRAGHDECGDYDARGQVVSLEVDITFRRRTTLFDIAPRDSIRIGDTQARNIPNICTVENRASKLTTCFARQQPKDLFDAVAIFGHPQWYSPQLRLCFVALSCLYLNHLTAADPSLLDMDLSEDSIAGLPLGVREYVNTASIKELFLSVVREGYAKLLPLTSNERCFIERVVYERKECQPHLLTDDPALAQAICNLNLLEAQQALLPQTRCGEEH